MPVVDPDPERLPDILATIPADTPVVMLNLLRFRAKARYKDGEADYDGREAYRRYSRVAVERDRCSDRLSTCGFHKGSGCKAQSQAGYTTATDLQCHEMNDVVFASCGMRPYTTCWVSLDWR